jgi:hypothetical protein
MMQRDPLQAEADMPLDLLFNHDASGGDVAQLNLLEA